MMMMMMLMSKDRSRNVIVGGWLVPSLLVAACATPSIRPEPIRLEGSWGLLTAVSEMPAVQPESVAAIASDGETIGQDPSVEALRAALRFATEPPRRMSIAQTPSSVTLTVGTGREFLLYTDGRPSEDLISGSRDCRCHATWRGGVLFVEQLLSGRTHVVQTYALSDDGRLLVTVMLQDSRLRRPLTSVRQYGAS